MVSLLVCLVFSIDETRMDSMSASIVQVRQDIIEGPRARGISFQGSMSDTEKEHTRIRAGYLICIKILLLGIGSFDHESRGVL